MFYFVLDKIISPLTKVKNYKGMDRGGGYFSILDSDNEILIKKVSEVCEYYEHDRETEAINVYKEVLNDGHDNFELLALNKVADKSKWIFIGYDVGEDDESRWSAIVKHYDYINYDSFLPWMNRLNDNGLFATVEEAENFKDFYLQSSDPVLKSVSEKDRRFLYDTFKVYLYRR